VNETAAAVYKAGISPPSQKKGRMVASVFYRFFGRRGEERKWTGMSERP